MFPISIKLNAISICNLVRGGYVLLIYFQMMKILINILAMSIFLTISTPFSPAVPWVFCLSAQSKKAIVTFANLDTLVNIFQIFDIIVQWNGKFLRQKNLELGLISSLNLTTGGFGQLIPTTAATPAMSFTTAALLPVLMKVVTMTSFPPVRYENRPANLSMRFGEHFLDF